MYRPPTVPVRQANPLGYDCLLQNRCIPTATGITGSVQARGLPCRRLVNPTVRTMFALFATLGVAALTTPAHAQKQVETEIPLLVVIEDADESTVLRSSEIYREALNAMSTGLLFHGYIVIDEDAVRAEIGAPKPNDRRSKFELTQNIREILDFPEVKNRFRVWLLFRIHLDLARGTFSTRVTIRLVGELYDVNLRKLDSAAITREMSVTGDCQRRRDRCFIAKVGEEVADWMAGPIGDEMAVILNSYAPQSDLTRCENCTNPRDYTLPTTYDITLARFEQSEVEAITGVMADWFPGNNVSIETAESARTRSRYWYTTTARGHKLREWFHILLTDMNWNVNDEIRFVLDGDELLVQKLVRTPMRKPSPDEDKFPCCN